MKILFIGGTGNISAAVSKLALARGIELFHLNRGQRPALPGVQTLQADIADARQAAQALAGHTWDAVVNWVAFTPADVADNVSKAASA